MGRLCLVVVCVCLAVCFADDQPPERPYLKVFNRLPYPDTRAGAGHRRCGVDGSLLNSAVRLKVFVDGVAYLDARTIAFTDPVASLQTTFLQVFDMGHFACVVFEDNVVGVEIPTQGVLSATVISDDPAVPQATIDMSLTGEAYNLTWRVGSAAIALSSGPHPSELGDFNVVGPLTRVYVSPRTDNPSMLYSKNSTATVTVVEFMIPTTIVPSLIRVVEKTVNSIRMYFPGRYIDSFADSYRLTYGLPGAREVPEKVAIPARSEYAVEGLMPGTAYMFLYDVLSGNTTSSSTLELTTLLSEPSVIPAFSTYGECSVYQTEIGFVLVRMPVQFDAFSPMYKRVDVEFRDVSNGELLTKLSFDVAGDHRLPCPQCHRNGFSAKVACVEKDINGTSADGEVRTKDVIIKRSIGQPTELPKLPAVFEPVVVRTSANAMVVRVPEKLREGGKKMKKVDVVTRNMHTRVELSRDTITKGGDTILVVPDDGPWDVELTYTDVASATLRLSFQNYCPPKYEVSHSGRTFGTPLVRISVNGDLVINIAERLFKASTARVKSTIVQVRDPYSPRFAEVAAASRSAFGDIVVSGLSVWESYFVIIIVTEDSGDRHDFSTLVRRTSGSENVPDPSKELSIVSVTRSGFMWRMPPRMQLRGATVKSAQLTVFETASWGTIRSKSLAGGASFRVDGLDRYPVTAQLVATFDRQSGNNQSTFFFVPRIDGLPPFPATDSQRTQAFIQLVGRPAPCFRVVVRVPPRNTDVPQGDTIEKIVVKVNDGASSGLLLAVLPKSGEADITNPGDYVIDNLPTTSVPVVTITTSFVSGAAEVCRVTSLDDLWGVDFITHSSPPTVAHGVGYPRIYPNPLGIVIHIPAMLDPSNQISQADVTIAAAPTGQAFTGTGSFYSSLVIGASNVSRVLLPVGVAYDVTIVLQNFQGQNFATVKYFVKSAKYFQSALSAYGPPAVLPLDDFAVVLAVPPLLHSYSVSRNVNCTFEVFNVNTGAQVIPPTPLDIGHRVLAFPIDLHGSYEFTINVTSEDGLVTNFVRRVLHNDVVMSSHLPPLSGAGFPFAAPFLHVVDDKCVMTIRVPVETYDMGHQFTSVVATIINDETTTPIANPSLRMGSDNFIILDKSLCSFTKLTVLTVKMVATDNTGSEYLVTSTVTSPTGGLPPLPGAGSPRVLKTDNGRAFIQLPLRLHSGDVAIDSATVTWKYFTNSSMAGFAVAYPGYTEVDPLTLSPESVYTFDFKVKLSAMPPGKGGEPPPIQTHRYEIEVPSLLALPNPPSESAEQQPSVVSLFRASDKLDIFVPSRLVTGDNVGSGTAVVKDEFGQVIQTITLGVGDNYVVGLSPQTPYSVDISVTTKQSPEQKAEEDRRKMMALRRVFNQFYSSRLIITLPTVDQLDPNAVIPQLAAGPSPSRVILRIPRFLDTGDYVSGGIIELQDGKDVTLKRLTVDRGAQVELSLPTTSGINIRTTCIVSPPPLAAELAERQFEIEVAHINSLPLVPEGQPIPSIGPPTVYRNAIGQVVVRSSPYLKAGGDRVVSFRLTVQDVTLDTQITSMVVGVGSQIVDPTELGMDPFNSFAFSFLASVVGDADIAIDKLSDQEKDVVRNIHKFVFHVTDFSDLNLLTTDPLPSEGSPVLLKTSNPNVIAVQIPLSVTDGALPSQLALVSFFEGSALVAEYTVNQGTTQISLEALGIALNGTYDIVVEVDSTPDVPMIPRHYSFIVHDFSKFPTQGEDPKQPVGPPTLLRAETDSSVVVRVPLKPSMTCTNVDQVLISVYSLDGALFGRLTGTPGDDTVVDLSSLNIPPGQLLRFSVVLRLSPRANSINGEPSGQPQYEPKTFLTDDVPLALLEDFPATEISPFGFPIVYKVIDPSSSSQICCAANCQLVVRVHPHLYPPAAPITKAVLQIASPVYNKLMLEFDLVPGQDATFNLTSTNLNPGDPYVVRCVVTADIGPDREIMSRTAALGYRALPDPSGVFPVLGNLPKVFRTIDETTIVLQLPYYLDEVSEVTDNLVRIFRLPPGTTSLASSPILQREINLAPGSHRIDIVEDWGFDWFEDQWGVGLVVIPTLAEGQARSFEWILFKGTMRRSLPMLSDPTRELTDVKVMAVRGGVEGDRLLVKCGGVRITSPVDTNLVISNSFTGRIYYQSSLVCPGELTVNVTGTGLTPDVAIDIDLHVLSDAGKPFIQTVPPTLRAKNPNIVIVVNDVSTLPVLENSVLSVDAGLVRAYVSQVSGGVVVVVPKRLTGLGNDITSVETSIRNSDGNLVREVSLKPGSNKLGTEIPSAFSLEMTVHFDPASHTPSSAVAAYVESPDSSESGAASTPPQWHTFVLRSCFSMWSVDRANVDGLMLMGDSYRLRVHVPQVEGTSLVKNCTLRVTTIDGTVRKIMTVQPGDTMISFYRLGMRCKDPVPYLISASLNLAPTPSGMSNSFTQAFTLSALPPQPSDISKPLYGEPELFGRRGVVSLRCPDRISQFGHSVDRCSVEVLQQNKVATRESVVPGVNVLDLLNLPLVVPYTFRVLVIERGSGIVPDTQTQTLDLSSFLLPPRRDDQPNATPLPTVGSPLLFADPSSTPSRRVLDIYVPSAIVEGGDPVLGCQADFVEDGKTEVVLSKVLAVGMNIIRLSPPLNRWKTYSLTLKMNVNVKSNSILVDGTPIVSYSSDIPLRSDEPEDTGEGFPIVLPVSVGDKVFEVLLPEIIPGGPYTNLLLRLYRSRDDFVTEKNSLVKWTLDEGIDLLMSFSSNGICFRQNCYLVVTGTKSNGGNVVLADAQVSPPTNDLPDPVAPVVYSDSPTEVVVVNYFAGQSVRVEVVDRSNLELVGTPVAHYKGMMRLTQGEWEVRMNFTRAGRLWGLDDAVIPSDGSLRIGSLEALSEYEVRLTIVQEEEEGIVQSDVRLVQTANLPPVPIFPKPLPLGIPRTGGLIPNDIDSLVDTSFYHPITIVDQDVYYRVTHTWDNDNFGSLANTVPDSVASSAGELSTAAAESGEASEPDCSKCKLTIRAGYTSILFDFPKLMAGAPLCKVDISVTSPGGLLVFAKTELHPIADDSDRIVSMEASGLQNGLQYNVAVTFASCLQGKSVCERTATFMATTADAITQFGIEYQHRVSLKAPNKICLQTITPFPSDIDYLLIGFEDTATNTPVMLLEQSLDRQRRLNHSMGADENTCGYNLRPGARYRFVVLMRHINPTANDPIPSNDVYDERCVWLTADMDPKESSRRSDPHIFAVTTQSIYIRLPESADMAEYHIQRVDYMANGVSVSGYTEVFRGVGTPDEFGPFYRIDALADMTNYTFKIEKLLKTGVEIVYQVSATTDSAFHRCVAGRPTDDMLPSFNNGPLPAPHNMWEPGSRNITVKFSESAVVAVAPPRYPLRYDFDVAQLMYASEQINAPYTFFIKSKMAAPAEGWRTIRIPNVTPGYDYRFRIRVSNVWGGPTVGPTIVEYTALSEVPEAPPSLRVVEVAARGFVVQWDQVLCPLRVQDGSGADIPHTYCNGMPVTAYQLDISPGPMVGDLDTYPSDFLYGPLPPFVPVFKGRALGFSVNGLLPATNYTVRVSAINDVGQSAFTVVKHFGTSPLRTLPDIPEHVTYIVNSTYEREFITVEWKKPRHNGLFIQYYNVYMRKCLGNSSCSGGWDLACKHVVGTRCTVFGITPGDWFSFRVVSANCKGTSDVADEGYWAFHQLNVRSHPAIPGQPTSLLKVRDLSSESFELAFTLPARDNGEPITRFSVECDAGAYCLSSYPMDPQSYSLYPSVTFGIGPNQNTTTSVTVGGVTYWKPPCYQNWTVCPGAWVKDEWIVTDRDNCIGNLTVTNTPADISNVPVPYLRDRTDPFEFGRFQRVQYCGKGVAVGTAGVNQLIKEEDLLGMSRTTLKRLVTPDEATASDLMTNSTQAMDFLKTAVRKRHCIQTGTTVHAVVSGLKAATTYRCRGSVHNLEGDSMWTKSVNPFTKLPGASMGYFDYFRTPDSIPLPVVNVLVVKADFENKWKDSCTGDNSCYAVGVLMTEGDLPAVSDNAVRTVAQITDPDRVKFEASWDNRAFTPDERGQPVYRYRINRRTLARTVSSSLRPLQPSEMGQFVDYAVDIPAHRLLTAAAACKGGVGGCRVVDDNLKPDTYYTYSFVSQNSVGMSDPVILSVKTVPGRPQKLSCVAGQVFSQSFYVKCLTGDDWGSPITNVTYSIRDQNGLNVLQTVYPDCRTQYGVEIVADNNTCAPSRVAGLDPATTYSIVGWAVNGVGKSPVSSPISVTTIAGRPPTPAAPISNAAIVLQPPPKSDQAPYDETVLLPMVAPTSRRLSIKYATPPPMGANLTYCDVRIRGVWPGSTRFNELAANPSLLKCNGGGEANVTFDRTKFVDSNGYVKAGANQANVDILNSGCWVEERVYRHRPEDSVAYWFQSLNAQQKVAALRRWGVPLSSSEMNVLATRADTDAVMELLRGYGGPEADESLTMMVTPPKTNPHSRTLQPRYLVGGVARTWVLPLTHTDDNLVSGPPVRANPRSFSPDNPHLFSSLTYRVSVACANDCDWAKLIDESNLYSSTPIDKSVGDAYCLSGFSPEVSITSAADPPPAPAPPTRQEPVTSKAVALHHFASRSSAEALESWSMSVSCVKGWCPELMCGTITPDNYTLAVCAKSPLKGYCTGLCNNPRWYVVPSCYKKQCVKVSRGASADVWSAMCTARVRGGIMNDTSLMVGCTNATDVVNYCMDEATRGPLQDDYNNCHDFGNRGVCDECVVGPPYGSDALGLNFKPYLLSSVPTTCTMPCDNVAKADPLGCCSPLGSVVLMPGTTYSFRSQSVNAAGPSAWSPTRTVTLCAVDPDPVSDLAVTWLPKADLDISGQSEPAPSIRNKGVLLSWDAPSFDGGCKVHQYKVEFMSEKDPLHEDWQSLSLSDYPSLQCAGWQTLATAPTCDPTPFNDLCTRPPVSSVKIYKLLAGTAYKFRVTALNAFGESVTVYADAHHATQSDDPEVVREAEASLDVLAHFSGISSDSESEPLAIVTPGDISDLSLASPAIVSYLDSADVSWSAPTGASVLSENFVYALEFRLWTTIHSDTTFQNGHSPTTGFLGVATSPLTWAAWAGDTCSLALRTVSVPDVSNRPIPLTNCLFANVGSMSLSPSKWATVAEAATIGDVHVRYSFRLWAFPENISGACHLSGSTCSYKVGPWVDAPLNNNIFANCDCGSHGTVSGTVVQYLNSSSFCSCACNPGFAGSRCDQVAQLDSCYCNGALHCHTLRTVDTSATQQQRTFDLYCPGEHVYYNSANFGVDSSDQLGRERIHTWMRKYYSTVAQQKMALKFQDDNGRNHVIRFENLGSSGYLSYSGPGPVYTTSSDMIVCPGNCDCWSIEGTNNDYYVPITGFGRTGRMRMHMYVTDSMSGSFGLSNDLTGTSVGGGLWWGFLDSSVTTFTSSSAGELERVNSLMGDGYSLATGMCGMEGVMFSSAVNTLGPRPYSCSENLNHGTVPSVIGSLNPNKSLFTFDGDSSRYCTRLLKTGANDFDEDQYYGYPRVSGTRTYDSSALQVQEGSVEVATEEAPIPRFDKLGAIADLRDRNRHIPSRPAPLVPRMVALAENITRDYLHHRQLVEQTAGQALLQSTVEQIVMRFDEVEEQATAEAGVFRASVVGNPDKNFNLIVSEYERQKKQAQLGSLQMVDPTALGLASIGIITQPPLPDLSNEAVAGADVCAKELLASAAQYCNGLGSLFVDCVRDVCLSGEPSIAASYQATAQTLEEESERTADANVNLAEQYNNALASDMAAGTGGGGHTSGCPEVVMGDEPWNIPPFDKEIPAWTYQIFEMVMLIVNGTVTATNTTVDAMMALL